MPDNEEYIERTTEGPTVVRREETRVVRGSGSATGWIVAAIVAVVAVVGVFLFMNQNNQSDVQAARDEASANQAQLDSSTATAQTAANAAAQAAQSSMSSAAQANQTAAGAAADRSAAAADQAARDASATAPSPPPQ